MKKIGKEVAWIKTKQGNPRNGEGSFARLLDGSIVHVYTEYYGNEWEDLATARLCAIRSTDEGETWSEPFVWLEKDENAQNYMSPSLFRLPNGELGMFFCRNEQKSTGLSVSGNQFLLDSDRYVCMPVFVYSQDEGKTWSDFRYCIDKDGYYCGINDGILVQKSGRIMMPLSAHYADRASEVIIVCSEDNGRTWARLPHVFDAPYADFSNGMEEPGLYEHENGELWMYARTIFGYQYQSRSKNNGVAWSQTVPNLYFTSPNAPMRVKKVANYTLAVFNPQGANCMRTDYSVRGSIRRTPLVCAVSRDDGASFQDFGGFSDGKQMIEFAKHTYLLEDCDKDTYCYPSILETRDGFLCAYYHSDGGTYTLASTKITKVYFDELDG